MLVLASISETLVNETAHFVREGGLPGIFVLMALSSACIPIPSEAVMLFAGFAVADPGQSASQHHMTLLGSRAGGAARDDGGLVDRLRRRARRTPGAARTPRRRSCTWGPARSQKADRWFQRYGEPAVLFGRMMPVVRAFVSLPAGIAKMPFGRFTVFSLIGTCRGCSALALAGHALGGDWKSVRKDFEYVDYAIVVLAVAGIGYWIVRRRGRSRDGGGAAGGLEGGLNDTGADAPPVIDAS